MINNFASNEKSWRNAKTTQKSCKNNIIFSQIRSLLGDVQHVRELKKFLREFGESLIQNFVLSFDVPNRNYICDLLNKPEWRFE